MRLFVFTFLALLFCSILNAQNYRVINDTTRATCIVTDDEGMIIYETYTGWYTSQVKIDEYALLYVEEPTPIEGLIRRAYINSPFDLPNILYYSFLDVDPTTGWYRQRLDVTPTQMTYLNKRTFAYEKAERSIFSKENLNFLVKNWKIYGPSE